MILKELPEEEVPPDIIFIRVLSFKVFTKLVPITRKFNKSYDTIIIWRSCASK